MFSGDAHIDERHTCPVMLCLQGLYFVASTEGDANGWIDALSLAGHLAAVSRLAPLRQSLQVVERGPNAAAPPSTP